MQETFDAQILTLEKEQFGGNLDCVFAAEPFVKVVKVIDLSLPEENNVIHESFYSEGRFNNPIIFLLVNFHFDIRSGSAGDCLT